MKEEKEKTIKGAIYGIAATLLVIALLTTGGFFGWKLNSAYTNNQASHTATSLASSNTPITAGKVPAQGN